ncbi:hypothetical protein DFQ30_005382 [Apophysomyces sp. BC1015]|nr:hypothetical protein DFQ30_005382 [Apophysomyces sp. BC1015]KAG0177485.1 hypothetical protein DFQ29_004784 [Apophysomyces sp. BC1021]
MTLIDAAFYFYLQSRCDFADGAENDCGYDEGTDSCYEGTGFGYEGIGFDYEETCFDYEETGFDYERDDYDLGEENGFGREQILPCHHDPVDTIIH